MPAAVPVIIAAVAGGVTVEAGVIGFSVVGALVAGGLALAGSVIGKAMAKTPDIPVFQRQLQDRSVTVRQPIAARRLVYGQARIGGVYTFIHVTGSKNQYLHLVITLSGKRLAGIDNLYFDGEHIPMSGNVSTGRTAGKVHMYTNLGDTSQAAIAALVSAVPDKWTANHRQRGCGHVYLMLEYDSDIFPSGIPNCTFDVRGYDGVYDPRTALTGYSTNAALCQADYLDDPVYGLAAQYSTEIVDDDLIEAANVCDEDVALAAEGTEKRYALNGVIDTSNTPKEIIKQMLTASSGTAVSQGNLWHIHAGAHRTPVMDLDANDLVGPIKFQTRHARTDLFNSVQGTYVSPDNDWQPADFPPVSIPAYVTEDNGEEIWQDAQLPFTISGSASQRIVRNQIEVNRRQINGVIQCKSRAWEIAAGETFTLTLSKYGWVKKEFTAGAVRLVQVGTPPALVVEIDIAETDASVWSWSTGNESPVTPPPATTLPNPFNFAPPTSLIWTANDIYSSGTGVLSWTAAASAFVEKYEVQYLPPGDSVYLEHAPVTEPAASFDNLSTGDWTFRVRSNSRAGTHSIWVYKSVTIAIPTVPNITGLQLLDGDTATTFIGGDAKFAWDATTLNDRPGNDGAGPWFKSYKVEIVKNSTVVRTEYPDIPAYVYTYEANIADGGPDRDFDIYVYIVGDQGQESLVAATMSVSNPAPTMAGYTPTVTDTFKGVDIDWSAWSTADADFTSFKIYVDTNPTPTTLVQEVSRVTRHWLQANLAVGTNYKVQIVPVDAFGPGTGSDIGAGTPLILPATDVNVELNSSIAMSDSMGTAAATLAKLYDRNVGTDGVVYNLGGADKWTQYLFGLVNYIDRVIVHAASGTARVYFAYSDDGATWNYLAAEADHTLTATGELVAMADQTTAMANYLQLTAGVNVAVFPQRLTAKYCRMYMTGTWSDEIYELVFSREVIAEEVNTKYLSAIAEKFGVLYSDNYDSDAKTGIKLDGVGGLVELYNAIIKVQSWADVASAAGDAPAANATATHTFTQATAPTDQGEVEGDIWYNSASNYDKYRYESNLWVLQPAGGDDTQAALQASGGVTITGGGIILDGGTSKVIVKDASGTPRVKMGYLT